MVKIQAMARGRKARKETSAKKVAKLYKNPTEKEEKAAVTIQGQFRKQRKGKKDKKGKKKPGGGSKNMKKVGKKISRAQLEHFKQTAANLVATSLLAGLLAAASLPQGKGQGQGSSKEGGDDDANSLQDFPQDEAVFV